MGIMNTTDRHGCGMDAPPPPSTSLSEAYAKAVKIGRKSPPPKKRKGAKKDEQ